MRRVEAKPRPDVPVGQRARKAACGAMAWFEVIYFLTNKNLRNYLFLKSACDVFNQFVRNTSETRDMEHLLSCILPWPHTDRLRNIAKEFST